MKHLKITPGSVKGCSITSLANYNWVYDSTIKGLNIVQDQTGDNGITVETVATTDRSITLRYHGTATADAKLSACCGIRYGSNQHIDGIAHILEDKYNNAKSLKCVVNFAICLKNGFGQFGQWTDQQRFNDKGYYFRKWYTNLYSSQTVFLNFINGIIVPKDTTIDITIMYEVGHLFDRIEESFAVFGTNNTEAVNACTRQDLLDNYINRLHKTTTTKTLTLGATLLAKLTDEDKKIATDKGWTLA